MNLLMLNLKDTMSARPNALDFTWINVRLIIAYCVLGKKVEEAHSKHIFPIRKVSISYMCTIREINFD